MTYELGCVRKHFSNVFSQINIKTNADQLKHLNFVSEPNLFSLYKRMFSYSVHRFLSDDMDVIAVLAQTISYVAYACNL